MDLKSVGLTSLLSGLIPERPAQANDAGIDRRAGEGSPLTEASRRAVATNNAATSNAPEKPASAGGPRSQGALAPDHVKHPEHHALRQIFMGLTRVSFDAKAGGRIDEEAVKTALDSVADIATRLSVPHQDRIEGLLAEISLESQSDNHLDLQKLHRIVLHLAHYARNQSSLGPEESSPINLPAGFDQQTPGLDLSV